MSWDFIYRGETKDLDDAMRNTASSGSFIKLHDGCTHYEIDGIPTEVPVVLIHGFSVPYFIWDPTFKGLTSHGFYVMRYDLFGRGFSDRPRLNYDINLFVRQLHDLLDSFKFPLVNLIGLSMGGAIASAYTVDSPSRVRRLVLIDPIGVAAMPLNLIYRAAVLPGISELILGLAGTKEMASSVITDFFDTEYIKEFQNQYLIQMSIKGFKRAILSTLRNRMVNGFPLIYKQLGRLQIPVMLLWGQNDRTLPLEQSEPLLRLIPKVEFHSIENSGHIPHYERPDIVNPILIKFLNQ
jgi:pimeloyl-ACP methyl ester carboxylesterase